MPRYMVERTFPDGLAIPISPEGAETIGAVIRNNTSEQVTWVRSFITDDRHKSFCVYDAPSPEAVRRAADRSGLPIDSISDVTVLDPYFYLGTER